MISIKNDPYNPNNIAIVEELPNGSSQAIDPWSMAAKDRVIRLMTGVDSASADALIGSLICLL